MKSIKIFRKKGKRIMVVKTQSADCELGICDTKNLTEQREQLELWQEKCVRLRTTSEQRISNLEVNLSGLKQKRDTEIAQLRVDYDKALTRGDAISAGEILRNIKKCFDNLVAVARQVKEADGDIEDLRTIQDELRSDALKLITITERNFLDAQQQDILARALLSDISSVDSNFQKYAEIHAAGLKVADQILSE
jgi:hypothetical protein